MNQTPSTTEEGRTLSEIAKDILTQTEPDPRNNGELLADHGLKLVHIRPENDFRGRGMTVAFREVNKNVIEIATAIVHTNDTFTKKVGARLAIENFIAGRTVYVRRLFPAMSATVSIQAMFGM